MSARNDVIVALAEAYEALPAGELNGFRLGRMLDTVPTDQLVRLANERRMTNGTGETFSQRIVREHNPLPSGVERDGDGWALAPHCPLPAGWEPVGTEGVIYGAVTPVRPMTPVYYGNQAVAYRVGVIDARNGTPRRVDRADNSPNGAAYNHGYRDGLEHPRGWL